MARLGVEAHDRRDGSVLAGEPVALLHQVIDAGCGGPHPLRHPHRRQENVLVEKLRDVGAGEVGGAGAAEEGRGRDAAGAVARSGETGGAREVFGGAERQRMGVVDVERQIAQQRLPVELDQLGGLFVAREARGWG